MTSKAHVSHRSNIANQIKYFSTVAFSCAPAALTMPLAFDLTTLRDRFSLCTAANMPWATIF
jgi:hypothetical protein